MYRERRHLLKINHCDKSRKDNEVCKKGDEYWFWFRKVDGKKVKFYSAKYPSNEQIEASKQK